MCWGRWWWSFRGEGRLAAEAGPLAGLTGALPGHFTPVLQGEEMVVAAGQVRAENQGEFAGRAGGGEGADFAAAAGAQVAAVRGAGVAGAYRWRKVDDARWEPHHQEGGLDGGLFRLGRIIVRREGGRGRGGVHEKFAEMDFVEGDRVGLGRRQCGIGAGDERDEEGDLSSKANHAAGDMCGGQSGNGAVDVARVGR